MQIEELATVLSRKCQLAKDLAAKGYAQEPSQVQMLTSGFLGTMLLAVLRAAEKSDLLDELFELFKL